MNFALGAVITGLLFAFLYPVKPVEEHWRQCAHAQAGEQLVSSIQYEEKTECFYQKMDRISRHKVSRKERA